jgi:hypothetical protein
MLLLQNDTSTVAYTPKREARYVLCSFEWKDRRLAVLGITPLPAMPTRTRRRARYTASWLAANGAASPDAFSLIFIPARPTSPPQVVAAWYAVICERPRDKHGEQPVAEWASWLRSRHSGVQVSTPARDSTQLQNMFMHLMNKANAPKHGYKNFDTITEV